VTHDFLNTREYLATMSRSKIVLNTTPNGKYSMTERQLSAMMNGAAVATDTNDYIEQCFADNSIIGFSHKDYKALADKLLYLLASPQKLEEIARNGEEAAKKNHTVQHRAANLISVAETGRLLLS
jgi:spore maturation protein CgeB